MRRNKEILRGSTLAPFNPVLVNGIWRSNTRLRHADDLTYDVKCPIILPKRNHVTGLIVKYYHELVVHQMGLNYTVNHVMFCVFETISIKASSPANGAVTED